MWKMIITAIFSVLLIVGLVLLVVFHKDILAVSDSYLMTKDANSWLKVGNKLQAQAIYERALKKHPENIRFALSLAHMNAAEKHWEDAEIFFQKALAHQPENLEALLGYGMVLAKTGRYSQAVSIYRKALKAHGANPILLTYLGDLYRFAAEDPAETRAHTQKTLYDWSKYYYSLAKNQLPEEFHVLFQLGYVYEKLDKPEQASHYLCQALLQKPDRYEARYNLGLALVKAHAYKTGFEQLAMASTQLANQNRMNDAQALSRNIAAIKASMQKTEDELKQPDARLPEGVLPGCLTLSSSASSSEVTTPDENH
jgi:tetratricopeptide (TPR) repeat protein